MKNLKTIALTVSLLALLSVPAFAQNKVATVDMKKIFNEYWKTKQAQVLLEKDKTNARKDLKDMSDGLEKAQADYKQALEQANDQAISSEERDKRKQAADGLLKDLSDRKAAFDQYQRQVESTLADKSQRMSGNLVVDIQKAVSDKAKAGGFTLVLNSATTEVVVYSAGGDNDLTAAVIAQLNAGAPIDVAPVSAVSTNAP